jgi:hypothetical protein
VKRTRQPTARRPPRSKLPWIRELVLEAQSSDLLVSIFKKSQKRKKKASGSEQAIRLVLILVWAIVIVVLGFLRRTPTITPPLAFGAQPRTAWRPPTLGGSATIRRMT